MISIEEKQEELNKMIEEYEKQKEIKADLISTWDKNWKPTIENKYYFIDCYNDVSYEFYEDSFDEKLIKYNRVFKTEELAEKWLEIDTYLREKSFEPDWNDENQKKYFIYYNNQINEFVTDFHYKYSYFEPFYFETEEIIDEIFKKYTTEELKFYFNIGE